MLRRVCAYAQTRLRFRSSHTYSMDVGDNSGQRLSGRLLRDICEYVISTKLTVILKPYVHDTCPVCYLRHRRGRADQTGARSRDGFFRCCAS